MKFSIAIASLTVTVVPSAVIAREHLSSLPTSVKKSLVHAASKVASLSHPSASSSNFDDAFEQQEGQAHRKLATCNICALGGELIPDRQFVNPNEGPDLGVISTCGQLNGTELENCAVTQQTVNSLCCQADFKPCGMCASGDSMYPPSPVDNITVVIFPSDDGEPENTVTCPEIGAASAVFSEDSPFCWGNQYLSHIECGCPKPIPDPPKGSCTVCPNGNGVDFHKKEFVPPDDDDITVMCYQAEYAAVYSGGICSDGLQCQNNQYCKEGMNTDDKCTNCPVNEVGCGDDEDCKDECFSEGESCQAFESNAAKHCCVGVGDCELCPNGLANPDVVIPHPIEEGNKTISCGDLEKQLAKFSDGTDCTLVVQDSIGSEKCICKKATPSPTPDTSGAHPALHAVTRAIIFLGAALVGFATRQN